MAENTQTTASSSVDPMAAEPTQTGDQVRAQNYVDVDPILETQIKALANANRDGAKGLLAGEPIPWMRPDKGDSAWLGDPSDFTEVATAFSPEATETAFAEGIADPKKPSSAGDAALASMQVDYLSILERSWRSRHMSRTRLFLHTAGRKKGHGMDDGPLVKLTLEYFRGLARMNRG